MNLFSPDHQGLLASKVDAPCSPKGIDMKKQTTGTKDTKEGGREPKRAGKQTKSPGIKKTKRGYRIEVRATDPKTGKRIGRDREIIGISKNEAVALRSQWKEELLMGRQEKAVPKTLSDCARAWLKYCTGKGEARSTLENKVEVLTNHVLPVLGNYYTEYLDREDLMKWVEDVSRKRMPNGERYAKETVLCWWRRLKALLRWVVAKHKLPSYPKTNFRYS